ncbi:GtrA family protein [Pseudomonas carassii]|uniref:Bactoprenol-linked glucose translocase n=1 Tax=Pseudomonas carassii TaxID=3115855 RepID=A0ABU7H6J6_9PSED|nr:GtrA family protein [Pseudomonas sp. 137P]MEE1886963.1 GtrA family protein [Pseudomonas sp. 137P]
MRGSVPAFFRYVVVGLFNTTLHIVVFTAMRVFAGADQATSNLIAFFAALSFSFVANAWFTFQAPISLIRYLTFVIVMGSLSFTVGCAADLLGWPSIVTVLVFSLISLLLGFLFSKWLFTQRRKWTFR